MPRVSPPTIELRNIPCRICMMGAFENQHLRRRCSCACYHDGCFIEWLKRRQSTVCEICNQPYSGVRYSHYNMTIMSLQWSASVWLIIYGIIIILLWVLKHVLESYSNCIQKYRNKPLLVKRHKCSTIGAIEEFVIVICSVATVTWVLKCAAVWLCPQETGFLAAKRISRLIVDGTTRIPLSNEAANRETDRANLVLEV